MKKKIIIGIIASAAIITSWNFSQNKKNISLSELTLANVEALANGEINQDCPNGCLVVFGPGCWCYSWHWNMTEEHWN